MNKLNLKKGMQSFILGFFKGALVGVLFILMILVIIYIMLDEIELVCILLLLIAPSMFLFSERAILKKVEKTLKLKDLEFIIDEDTIHITSLLISYSSILLFLFFLRSIIESIEFYYFFIFLILLAVFTKVLSHIFSKIWYPLFSLELKKKVILHVYLSFEQILIIYFILSVTYLFFLKLYPWFTNRIFSQAELMIPMHIKDLTLDSEDLTKILFTGVVFLIMVLINIKINNWRITRRFKHIIGIETKDLKKEKNKIIERIKSISTLALKNKHDERQYWRVFILKQRLEYINSEIEEISQLYSFKKNYVFKISLISVLYVLASLVIKIFEIFS